MDQVKVPTELKLFGNVGSGRFKHHFTLDLQAMGASKKENIPKLALFLTIAGSEAPDVFNSFQLTQA